MCVYIFFRGLGTVRLKYLNPISIFKFKHILYNILSLVFSYNIRIVRIQYLINEMSRMDRNQLIYLFSNICRKVIHILDDAEFNV